MKAEIIISIVCLVGFYLGIMYIKIKLNKNINPKKEALIYITVTKEKAEQLKAYALIKGFKNENEFIAHLINEELQKDNELIKKS